MYWEEKTALRKVCVKEAIFFSFPRPILQVSRQEAERLAGVYGMRYIETSARDAINVERAFTELTKDIFALVRSGEISIQEGWEGVKSGFVPNVVHSSEEVTKSDRRCIC